MVKLPLPEDKASRGSLIFHELFHRIQPKIGFDSLYQKDNKHLDTYIGRVLLKLELETLKTALDAKNNNSLKLHLSNALTFRSLRQSNNKKKEAENSLEINEGLAEYTGAMFSGRNNEEMKNHFKSNIDKFYKNETFVRSFAYQTIPVYGYLLTNSKKNWHKEINKYTNLTDYFIASFEADVSKKTYQQVASNDQYRLEEIEKNETIRENEKLKKLKDYKETFLQKPTLQINFIKMSISFNPNNISPLENFGTVYPTLRVTDNWGVLTVTKGALLSSNWSNVIVTEPQKISNIIVEGDGWKLELNESWEVKKTGRKYSLLKNKLD